MNHSSTKIRKATKYTYLLLLDVISCFLSFLFAGLLGNPEVSDIFRQDLHFLLFATVAVILFFALFHLYRVRLSMFGAPEAVRLGIAVILVTVFAFLFTSFFSDNLDPAYCVNFALILFLLTGVGRSTPRILVIVRAFLAERADIGDRVMVVGAGEAADLILREMRSSEHLELHPICLVDDDPELLNTYVEGVRVEGNTDAIPALCEKHRIEKIIIAIPSAPKQEVKRIHAICLKTPCRVQIIPGMYQLVNEQVSVAALRDVDVQDLLGREQIRVNLDEIMGYIEGRTVMVTGGGGSIGSELCRQIATHQPKLLIILDIYENNAYEIQQELLRHHPGLNLLALIASVRDADKINRIFDKYRPEIVFHAAAHKHVPLMETSPAEAIKNNVFGTKNVVCAADRYGTKKFVMISTDKAVNPTNVMGATKRICEMIVQTMARHSETEFAAVRFGNVLGSNGSVIPLFKKQIAEGGPVTLTHRDILRYFMTIPEAVSLVLQAGAYATGGEIFVLDMGEPVRIYDLAVNLIKLSGFEPGEDIKIEVTGLRPGEKLYEERLMDEEGMQKTLNDSINIGRPLEIDETHLQATLEKLREAAVNESEELRALVKELVPTYRYEEKK